MNKSKFAICTLAGCLPWNMILVYLGWHFGSSWSVVLEALRYLNIIVGALLTLLVWVVYKSTQERNAKGRDDAA